jgi:hypothetical protein
VIVGHCTWLYFQVTGTRPAIPRARPSPDDQPDNRIAGQYHFLLESHEFAATIPPLYDRSQTKTVTSTDLIPWMAIPLFLASHPDRFSVPC